MAEDRTILSWCNSCSRKTEHDVAHSETSTLSDTPDAVVERRMVVVRCRGCKELAIRTENWFFDYTPDPENDGGKITEVSYSPPRLWWRPPDWIERLEQVDPDLGDILAEIYLATNDKQFRLLAMGVRTALDYVMTQIVGDIGTFPQKLAAMVSAGHLSSKQAEMLETVIDAASAAAHRGFKPDRELLKEMVTTMETVVRDHYLTGPILKTMKALVPPRPSRTARP